MNNSNSNEVRVWEEQITIPTYGVGEPEKNPMFFEKRVYQGSSGVVYPHPVIEKILDEKKDKTYRALFLENEYIKIMVLPELGGRIHMAYDKIKERHFIYYNQVIKPALVGLTGPWISGGIEFNWPQHHRPSTFMPIDYKIEQNEDGSKTIWVNEIEQMFHTKGLAGFTLYPGKAYIEIKAKLLNTSNLPQTFLWWANPAVKVNDDYQSVFPPDVHAVFDHGKRDVSSFPIATGTYYKVDYSPGTDISMYKNIPVPTSYMAINSQYDFMGGYEHDTQAGMLHVADHHVSPGKKQWTWGHSDFGQAWDRNLTDEDGPYIELMAGMFTDNQPDFTWIMPNEEKSFTQYFLPYRELGIIQNASKDILLSFVKTETNVLIKLASTSVFKKLILRLGTADILLFEEIISLDPKEILERNVLIRTAISEDRMTLTVSDERNITLLRYEPALNKENDLPLSARPALAASLIENHEQLFLTAQHLEQYRHATYNPVEYYQKVLANDEGDIRCNNSLGLWWMRHGQIEKSISFFKNAIRTIISRNPNPYDCEPYFNLGVALKFLGRNDEAYDALNKSAWDNRWRDSALFLVAQIDVTRGQYEKALEHLDQALTRNSANSKAYTLKALVLRNLQRNKQAIEVGKHALAIDPFNLGALYEIHLSCHGGLEPGLKNQSLENLLTLSRGQLSNFLAYALDYAASGQFDQAFLFLHLNEQHSKHKPMYWYYQAWFASQGMAPDNIYVYYNYADACAPDLYFPNRLEEIAILQKAIKESPQDFKASYLLGNLYYDKRQYDEAITYWEISAARNNNFPTALRNLGIAFYNKRNEKQKALEYFESAFALDKSDARVLLELDQLRKRMNVSPVKRLQFLRENFTIVSRRDDLYLEYISLLNFTGEYETALDLLLHRKFHPWEGGEGRVSAQYVHSLVQLAKDDIADGAYKQAIIKLEKAQVYPHNLGEGKLFGAQENDVFYWLGIACSSLGETESAENYYQQASAGNAEPSAAIFYNDQQPDKIFYQGLAWKKLGQEQKSEQIFNNLLTYAADHENDEVKIDYFAVSLPDLLIFEDDLNARNNIHCMFMRALGHLGLKNYTESRAVFENVLVANPDHLKARTHLDMLKQAIELRQNKQFQEHPSQIL